VVFAALLSDRPEIQFSEGKEKCGEKVFGAPDGRLL
jgi:hypothetical protein